MTEITEMKPCPHCGGRPLLSQNYSKTYKTYFVFVRCEICRAQGKTFASKENAAALGWNNTPCDQAISAWNMRYKEEEPAADPLPEVIGTLKS